MKKIYDLSVTMANNGFDPRPPVIEYKSPKDTTRYYTQSLGIKTESFPDGEAFKYEFVTAITHSATHMDAPSHYGCEETGINKMNIDEVPLEWCYGDGVVLDFRKKTPEELISKDDIIKELSRINYKLKPGDIPCIMSLGGDKYLTHKEYSRMHSGITLEALDYLLDEGIVMLGTDGWSIDKPAHLMKKDDDEGVENAIWPVHFAGRKRIYCHIEKLANLDLLPKPHGFKIYAFPIKIARASGAWCRPVAIYED